MDTKKRRKISICDKNSISNSNLEERARPTILNLPDEIVLKIFSYLDVICLLQRVSLVCKAWKALAEDPSLWNQPKTLELWPKKLDNYAKTFQIYRFVQEIKFYHLKIGRHLLKLLSRLPRLQSLMFHRCKITKSEIKGSLEKLSLSSLKVLEVKNSKRIFDLMDPSVLKCLEFNKYSGEKENLVETLKNCSKLENLSLHGCQDNLNDETINCIIEILSDKLIKFSIRGIFTEAAVLSLRKCSKLTELSINGFNLKLCEPVFFQIMNLNSLKVLTMQSMHTSRNIEHFTEGQMDNLTYLKISNASLNDSDLIVIAKCCKKLSVLSLEYIKNISDVGLLTVVNNCSEIVDLYLIKVFSMNGTFLLEIIEKNLLQRLRKIEFSKSFIHRHYIDALEAARPMVQIYGGKNWPMIRLPLRWRRY